MVSLAILAELAYRSATMRAQSMVPRRKGQLRLSSPNDKNKKAKRMDMTHVTLR